MIVNGKEIPEACLPKVLDHHITHYSGCAIIRTSVKYFHKNQNNKNTKHKMIYENIFKITPNA